MRLIGASIFVGCIACSGCAEHRGGAPSPADSSVEVAASSTPPTDSSAPSLDDEPVPEQYLRYEVRDGADGALIPCKLTLVGVHGSRDPQLTRGDIPRQEVGGMAAYSRIFSMTGKGSARVPKGTYDVYVSRGPEWDLGVVRALSMTEAGASVRLDLHHVVDTSGWLSGDFHVHAAPSPDSRVPLVARVYEFLSDGVEMMVSTDHNTISDYAPIIAELGVQRYLVSSTGDEITTASWGHFGAFPLPVDPSAPGQGAIRTKGQTPTEIFADVRKDAPQALLNVNHPRFDRDMGYFRQGQLDAPNDRAGRRGFSFDFDAVEVLNGYQDMDQSDVDLVLEDWFDLLSHGHMVAATGNSDTHHLNLNLGGYPRNYVMLADDRPEATNGVAVAMQVKKLASFFTTGPFVTLTVEGLPMGSVAEAKAGKVHAEVSVQAPGWVSVSRVVLYVDGKIAQRWEVQKSSEPKRFHGQADLDVARDAFVVARVDGDEPLYPVVGGLKKDRVLPLAVTNPVFVDTGGDGRYDAPFGAGAR